MKVRIIQFDAQKNSLPLAKVDVNNISFKCKPADGDPFDLPEPKG